MTGGFLDRARRAARDPLGAARKIAATIGLAPRGAASATPAADRSLSLLRSYGEHARAAGIDRLYLFLSFDCDTDPDIAGAASLDAWLRGLGVRATYAVPGAQLKKGAASWRALAQSGAEFMNHGALPHAEWQGDRYHSITFYDTMPRDQVVADIEEGHRIALDVLGTAPLGFRAPHFGCFQQPDQLALVHATARRLGYEYCSTTIPAYALQHGPRVRLDGLVELPCFGSWRYPETILDSWTYLADRRNYSLTEEYGDLFVETVDRMIADGIPGVLTYYADPSHVLDQAPFRRAIEHAVARGVPSVTGSDLARRRP